MSSTIEDVIADPRVKQIRQLMDTVISSVNSSMDTILSQDDLGQIKELMTYQHSTGGKRLRPLLSVITGMTLHADYEEIVRASTICELVHTASLMLDDVVDWDKERRGEPTTMELFGIGSAVMGGISMTSEAVNQALSYGAPMIKLVVRTIRDLGIGNSEELLRVKPLDEDQYLRVIRYKTASLFSAACELGAIVARRGEETIKQAFEFGRCVGTLYQLCDDVVDAEKSIRLRQPIGDMKLGVITLPLIHTYRMTESFDIQERIKTFIQHGEISEEEILTILDEMDKMESTSYALEEIEQFSDAARDAISSWPDNEYKEMLMAMPEFMSNAILIEIESSHLR